MNERNGSFFLAILDSGDFMPSVWDPNLYKTRTGSPLSNWVSVEPVAKHKLLNTPCPFEPIEYKHIGHIHELSFALENKREHGNPKYPLIAEGTLLFGTMRAYLGNALVTPKAVWIDFSLPIAYAVKSEFVVVTPHDQLQYFWLTVLRSKNFLGNLPIGSGGTRPRLTLESLLNTGVLVPPLELRQEIDEKLKAVAERQWHNRCEVVSILDHYFTEANSGRNITE